jgi:type III secretion system low calcium response chaperone LcrH/SycD
MSEIGKSETLELNEDDIQTILAAMIDGVSPAEAIGLGQDKLEALYALGHRLYSAGEFKDAETAFRALCLYDYSDSRFMMGLGASLQAQEKLTLAAEIYGLAGLASSLADPAPFFYAGLCQLRNGDLESADATLAAIESMGTPGNTKDDAFKVKAVNLRSAIREKLASGKSIGDDQVKERD